MLGREGIELFDGWKLREELSKALLCTILSVFPVKEFVLYLSMYPRSFNMSWRQQSEVRLRERWIILCTTSAVDQRSHIYCPMDSPYIRFTLPYPSHSVLSRSPFVTPLFLTPLLHHPSLYYLLLHYPSLPCPSPPPLHTHTLPPTRIRLSHPISTPPLSPPSPSNLSQKQKQLNIPIHQLPCISDVHVHIECWFCNS